MALRKEKYLDHLLDLLNREPEEYTDYILVINDLEYTGQIIIDHLNGHICFRDMKHCK